MDQRIVQVYYAKLISSSYVNAYGFKFTEEPEHSAKKKITD